MFDFDKIRTLLICFGIMIMKGFNHKFTQNRYKILLDKNGWLNFVNPLSENFLNIMLLIILKKPVMCHAMIRILLITSVVFASITSYAQIDQSQLGAWYMLFLDGRFSDNSNFGFESDIQHRNYDAGADLEQLMLRGGLSYKFSETKTKLTLGYAHITSGTFGKDDNSKSYENRVYQQLVFSNKLFSRIYVTQRFRYEQRFVQQQDFRTRWRHFFAVNIPLNQNELMPSAFYLSMYNELFINGERPVGNDRRVELFDRNRFYMALGYQLTEKLKFQAGMMRQLTDVVGKNQVQIGIHTTL